MCFTICHGKRLSETFKLPRLSRVLGASRSWPASRKLQRFISVSSRTKLRTSRSRLGLGDMSLGSRLSLGSEGLMHILVVNPPNWLSNYILGGQLYTIYIRVTSEFWSGSNCQKVQPPPSANFSQFRHCIPWIKSTFIATQ